MRDMWGEGGAHGVVHGAVFRLVVLNDACLILLVPAPLQRVVAEVDVRHARRRGAVVLDEAFVCTRAVVLPPSVVKSLS